jgi:single-stranded-DNA-specific exonuclease
MEMQEKNWCLPHIDRELRQNLAGKMGVSETVAQVLLNRGYTNEVAARHFLYDDVEQLLDPFLLNDMEQAVQRICTALEASELITVYGDYDVDGISACSLLLLVLKELGARTAYYIPDRQSEGYGLNSESLKAISEQDCRLIITVDCGISSQREVAELPAHLDMIITDHHQPPEQLPAAFAVINPKRQDSTYPEQTLAGVGVAFKLCQALWLRLRPAADRQQLLAYCDLVALGTVADIVPLIGENRILVKLGLAQMNHTTNIGIIELMNVSQVKAPVDSGMIGFRLAPRLNAAGRMAHAKAGVELLTTTNEVRARELAQSLDSENRSRQEVEQQILAAAEAKLLGLDMTAQQVIIVAGENWHPGVIGIVASRLVQRYFRPVVVISLCEGIGKGSCRSIPAFDMVGALTFASQTLVQFGGHHQAAGLTVLAENLALLQEKLTEYAGNHLSAQDYVPHIRVDSLMALDDITDDFMGQITCLAPFGAGNPKPVFACRKVILQEVRSMGLKKQHLRLKVRQNRKVSPVVAFGMGDFAELIAPEQAIDLAFFPEYNVFNGSTTLQLRAQDIRLDQPHSEIDELFICDQAERAYQNIAQEQCFHTKIVGVTFDDRQAVIRTLVTGQKLLVLRESSNPYDGNAVALHTESGESVGYLKALLAEKLAPLMDEQAHYEAEVQAITGTDQESLGVNITVFATQLLCGQAKLRPQSCDAAAAVHQVLLGAQEYHRSQQAALAALAQGYNTLAIMGTGRGKSAIFQSFAACQALCSGKMSLVIYPLRALVNDQYIGIQTKLSPLGLTVYKGNGTLSAAEREDLFAALQSDKIDLLLATPEFVVANLALLKAKKHKIGFLVIDECHHIVLSGKRMRPVYQQLDKVQTELGNPLTLAVTATADDATAQQISQVLKIDQMIVDDTVRANLAMTDKREEVDKIRYIKKLLITGGKTLIYVNSRKQAFELACELRQNSPERDQQIGYYHAGLPNEWRTKVETWFRDGVITTLVATSAFGEGIDLPDIRHVILYHSPFHRTAFNQQCGRAGRDGREGTIHLLFGRRDIELNQLILANRAPSRDFVAAVYRVLRRQAASNSEVTLTNRELAEAVHTAFGQFVREEGVSVCLKILEDLKLLQRERSGAKRLVTLAKPPQHKLDIADSPTYLEGIQEQELFEQFAEAMMQKSSRSLLYWVNRPVCPKAFSLQ